MVARGTATSFPLLWQEILQRLQDGRRMEAPGKGVSLPRTGAELTQVVSLMLKRGGGI